MAKMFYNLKEAASRLGLSEDEISKLVDEGKLQQFRDRDKLMFKREQVDEMASTQETMAEAPSLGDEGEGTDELSLEDTVQSLATKTDKIDTITDEDADATSSGDGTALDLELDEASEEAVLVEETGSLSLSDTTGIDLKVEDASASSARTAPIEPAEAGASQTMELEELSFEDEAPEPRKPEPAPKAKPGKKDAGRSKAGTVAGATGISVFDTQEIEPADSMARTQVTKAFGGKSGGGDEEEELNLESVGSGSGLLDLTREADDTSLGAVELLDDIAPAGDKAPGGSVGGTIGGSVPGSATGIFEGAAEAEAAAAGTSGTINAEAEAPMGEEGPELAPASYAPSEGEDPVGDAWGGATLLGVFAMLVVAAMIALTALQGQFLGLTKQFTTLASKTDPQQSLYIMSGSVLGANIFLLVIGLFIGKSRAKRG